jgi:hypothetical protein
MKLVNGIALISNSERCPSCENVSGYAAWKPWPNEIFWVDSIYKGWVAWPTMRPDASDLVFICNACETIFTCEK